MTRGPAKQFDRDAVLERALQLFWDQGYEPTGMTQLLQHMGIGRQSLYDTFGDKKTLFLEALGHYFQETMQQAREVLEAPGSPLGNLRSLFYERARLTAETGHSGCFVGNALSEFGDRDPDVRRLVRGFMGQVEDGIRQTLERAREAGELSPQAPVAELARLTVITTQGMALLSKLGADTDASHRQIDAFIDLLRAA